MKDHSTKPEIPMAIRQEAIESPDSERPTTPDVRAEIANDLLEAGENLRLAGLAIQMASETLLPDDVMTAMNVARNALQAIDSIHWWLSENRAP